MLDTDSIPLNVDRIHRGSSSMLLHTDDVFDEVKVSY